MRVGEEQWDNRKVGKEKKKKRRKMGKEKEWRKKESTRNSSL